MSQFMMHVHYNHYGWCVYRERHSTRPTNNAWHSIRHFKKARAELTPILCKICMSVQRQAVLEDQLVFYLTYIFSQFFLTQRPLLPQNVMSLGHFNKLWSLLVLFKSCAHAYTDKYAWSILIQYASEFCHFFLIL